jgi:hypothetical protein
MTIPARHQPEVGIPRIGRRLRSLAVAALESNGIKQPRRKPVSEPAQADSCFSFGLLILISEPLLVAINALGKEACDATGLGGRFPLPWFRNVGLGLYFDCAIVSTRRPKVR